MLRPPSSQNRGCNRFNFDKKVNTVDVRLDNDDWYDVVAILDQTPEQLTDYFLGGQTTRIKKLRQELKKQKLEGDKKELSDKIKSVENNINRLLPYVLYQRLETCF